jgi:hypothetical protein
LLVAASIASLNGQTTAPPQRRTVAVPVSSDQPRALLDKYCVTCHNDRLKTANLSLQGLDLTKVADHADLWEKVVRKLRAGVMPPPDMPRPALAEYDGLRDWLEGEIDRGSAGRATPGVGRASSAEPY